MVLTMQTKEFPVLYEKGFNYLCHAMLVWRNDSKCEYMYVSEEKNESTCVSKYVVMVLTVQTK